MRWNNERELTLNTAIYTHLHFATKWRNYGVYPRSANVGCRTKERVHLWCVVFALSWKIAFRMPKASQGARTSGTSKDSFLNLVFTITKSARKMRAGSVSRLSSNQGSFLLRISHLKAWLVVQEMRMEIKTWARTTLFGAARAFRLQGYVRITWSRNVALRGFVGCALF